MINRMQLWYEDMIRFMRDASEYGTYNQKLAEVLAPALTKNMHICDAGCGLGYLSLALSPYVGRITSVDKNQDALAVLEENCRITGISSIRPVEGQIQEVPPEQKYDAMVFCFFGKIPEILSVARQQCRGAVFIITRTHTRHRFSVGDHATGTRGYWGAREMLTELGIPYNETIMEVEFGQPFRSFADVRLFFEMYSKDEDKETITDDFLRHKVIKTNDTVFPYYMPHLRKLAILELDAADIPSSFI